MKRDTVMQAIMIGILVLIIIVQIVARWSVCNGDMACFIVGPKYVVVQK